MKRPQLKMPGWRVPAPLADLYYDLVDRRLLPLVALVVVAIAAVPLLLGGSDGAPVPDRLAGGTSALDVAGAAQLTVVEAKPGLRDYRKRLAERERTDPFEQRYTQSNLSGAKLNPQTETTSGAELAEGGEPGAADGGSSPSSGGSTGGGSGGEVEVTFFSFAVKVGITKAGGKASASAVGETSAAAGNRASASGDGKPSASAKSKSKNDRWVRERVLPHTPLPGEKAPVVTYMGTNAKGTKAIMLVSTKVGSIFGDVHCVTNEEVCQLLEVEPGFPATFVYGGNEVRYTINVIKIFPVVVGHSKIRPKADQG